MLIQDEYSFVYLLLQILKLKIKAFIHQFVQFIPAFIYDEGFQALEGRPV
ncbi:MAG: hypothetical protein AAF587_41570 [Bacteroidota bacterium]